MSDLLEAVGRLWPWAAPGIAIAAALWRWWSGREPERTRRFATTEEVLFPRDGSSPRPLRGLARWLSAPLLLTLKEAGDQATADEMAGIREDLRRALADNKRLRAELASRDGSSAGSSATATARSPRSRTRARRSEKPESFEP